MARGPARSVTKSVETLVHDEASRKNIPTAELQSFAEADEAITGLEPAAYSRSRPLPEGETRSRDTDLDPQIVWNGARIKLTKEQVQALIETGEIAIGDAQLVWRGKDQQDWSNLIVQAPPLYIQEKIHPKAIIDDLRRAAGRAEDEAPDLFADFNGIDPDARTEFYQHDQQWSNRMILGDSLQVMASLAQREVLTNRVQCIYFDPPYGIKFNSNWQVSTQSRDVKDGKQTDISREPEQVKAFRDTWKEGIHSYLTYLRDRLTVARELLNERGSIFVQIGDENAHRVRALMDEVFGQENFLSEINYITTSGFPSKTLTRVGDKIIWYAKRQASVKYHQLYLPKEAGDEASREYKWAMLEDGTTRSLTEEEFEGRSSLPPNAKRWRYGPLTSSGASASGTVAFTFRNQNFHPGSSNHWKVRVEGLSRLDKAGLLISRKNSIAYYLFAENYPINPINNLWTNTKWGFDAGDKSYVVQTNTKVVEKCLLMATDPGDLVLDPTCGSGTTAAVAEQWGRRWITIDTSRVALALARTRLMSARYPFYLLADSPEGRAKEQAVSGRPQSQSAAYGDIRQGFVYERAPHVTLGSIANNAEIDVIWEQFQAKLEPLRGELNVSSGQSWEEWQIPREPGAGWPKGCQTALERDPGSASNRDPIVSVA